MTAWEWDVSLFDGTARHYEQGRLPYAEGLADAFRDDLGADGTGRLLDMGCGPGSIALRLAGRYREVVGLDPDPGMLREAGRLAAERRIANATFVQSRAEDPPGDLGLFDNVTFANSFHWMKRDTVAETVRTMLTAGGAVVHIDAVDESPEQPTDRYPAPPHEAVRDLVRRYLGAERRAGQSTGFVSPGNEEAVWSAAGYDGPDIVRVRDGRILDRTTDDVIAGTLSMSSSAPHLFGERLNAFENDLRALLQDASPAGRFTVALPDTRLRIWRPR